MNILVTNDDGIRSEGINALALALCKEHKVLVVAPDGERSASGHAITINRPLSCKKYGMHKNIEAYEMSGTPADCVKFALSFMAEKNIEMVVSGINHGKNLGTDVLYSGTVSAAFEGVIGGVKALAVSCAGRKGHDFVYAAEFIRKNLSAFYAFEGRGSVINVNFPLCKKEDIKGIRVAPLGIQKYNDSYVAHAGGGQSTFILEGEVTHQQKGGKRSADIYFSDKNYITVTPLKPDVTDKASLKLLKATQLEL